MADKETKPEEPKEMTPEEKAQEELIKTVTSISVRTVLVLIASFLKAAVNTKIKDKEGLREPNAREVVDITISLLADAIKNLEVDVQKNTPEERSQANGETN